MALNIQHDVDLQPYNTMGVPARARELLVVDYLQELREALAYAEKNDLKVLVLGEGSNTIFTADFDGLVLLNRLQGIEVVKDTEKSVVVKVAAGEVWHDFVATCMERYWYGLENLALIPGLVGAAPMQNIGAYGVELKDSLLSVEYVEVATGRLREFDNEQCQFAYRDSIFKHELANRVVITAITLELSKLPNPNLSYPSLASALERIDDPSPQLVFDTVCWIRGRKLPLPADIPNTGSFFKNPKIDSEQHERLLQAYPDLVSFAEGDRYKVAAGWLIERAGWKHRTIGQVSVHKEQALVITNPYGASGSAVLKYAQAIQQDIVEKFQIHLEIEPQLI
ncbi:MAG: UDP-N-acetylmuramate dehydrogenase [Pseudomonadota bacterium]